MRNIFIVERYFYEQYKEPTHKVEKIFDKLDKAINYVQGQLEELGIENDTIKQNVDYVEVKFEWIKGEMDSSYAIYEAQLE